MFEKSISELSLSGGNITANEIRQQPEMWLETLDIFKEKEAEIKQFLQTAIQSANGKLKVIFSGAGSSQYIGDTLCPYLSQNGDNQHFSFHSIATTDIVAVPGDFLLQEEPTIMVSFGRSGNSPESLAAISLADQRVKTLHHIVITCAKDGMLAETVKGRDNSLLLFPPEQTNDKGFAMTGSFSCMLTLALLIFDETNLDLKTHYLKTAASMGKEVIKRENEIESFLNRDYERIIYLGSGSLARLAREAQLKVLELTAGKLVTLFDSSMGFRHGPKSFINDKSLLFMFVSSDAKVRRYDLDVLKEVATDKIAAGIMAIAQDVPELPVMAGDNFIYEETSLLPEAYLALPDIMAAHVVAFLSSIKVGNTPDTPSPTGTVNRVVKGVTIYPNTGNGAISSKAVVFET